MACYWSNKVLYTLTNIESKVKSIKVLLFQPYFAGSYSKNGTNIACYWKNGVIKELTNVSSTVNSIFLSSSDVYTGGTISTNAFYSKNDEIIVLTNLNSSVESIYVIGSDVYVAGFYYSGNIRNGCYWKNSTLHIFDKTNLTINSIIVVSNN